MKYLFGIVFIFGILGISPGLYAAGVRSPEPHSETLRTDSDTTNEGRKRKKLASFLVNSVRARPPKQIDREQARQELDYLRRFEGKTIANIFVYRNNVFAGDSLSWLDRTANSTHVVTKERQIRKDLLFHPGDKFSSVTLMNNRRLIRSRDYIADVNIIAVPNGADSASVDVYVLTRDKWTISADARIKGNGESYIELYDDNILGWGRTLSIRTYFDWKDKFRYGGNLVEYRIANLFGTFFDGRLVAGKGFDNAEYGAEFQKEFIRPSDYAGGVTALYRQEPIGIFPADTSIRTSSQQYELWGGKSFSLPKLGNSLYVTGRYLNKSFEDRPKDVSSIRHPYFHNENTLLGSIGLYRERFLTARNIFGYGVTEYIAYGYRFGFTGGYSWGEFGNRWYLGGDFRGGYFMKLGYLGWNFAMGSYMNNSNGEFYRTTMQADLKWFSNLWGQGRYRYRQFVTLNATRGWKRQDGYRETLEFTHDVDVRGLKEDAYGRNRLVLNSETVVFTPWHIAQFKIALFGFWDMGLIGNHGNLLRNDFYSGLGVGVRIKNENLIFSTINIRIGFAMNKRGFADAHYFRISSEDRLDPIRYIPEKATPVDYR